VTNTEPAPAAHPTVSRGKLLKSPPAGSPRGPETVGLKKKMRPLMVNPWLKSRTVYRAVNGNVLDKLLYWAKQALCTALLP